MNRTSIMYYAAGALALIAALIVVFTGGFLEHERFRAGFYIFWAAIMFAFGYRRQQRSVR